MGFHDILLPKFMQPYLVASPYYSTSIARTSSGRELRSADNNLQQTKYILRGCYLSQNQFDEFNSFFRARMGQKFSFLLKDPAEYSLQKQKIDVQFEGGLAKIDKLYKYYHDDIMPAIKHIRHIIPLSIKIWIDDNQYDGEILVKDDSISFELDPNKGNNFFVSAEYLHEVRFAQDGFEYRQADNGAIELLDIEMIEVIPINN